MKDLRKLIEIKRINNENEKMYLQQLPIVDKSTFEYKIFQGKLNSFLRFEAKSYIEH